MFWAQAIILNTMFSTYLGVYYIFQLQSFVKFSYSEVYAVWMIFSGVENGREGVIAPFALSVEGPEQLTFLPCRKPYFQLKTFVRFQICRVEVLSGV